MMTRQMYPLNALRAFEAAGRHLSFVKAAQELYVTPAAISHQVKRLEDYLGLELFERLPNGLTLTQQSEHLLPQLRKAFLLLDKSVERARSTDWRVKAVPPKSEVYSDRQPSIVVLPFTNMSGDPEQEFFSDGLTEDIIAELARNTELPVFARSTTFTYKGTQPDARQVSRKLGVRYVLEGSVRKLGQRVRVLVQLIDGHSGHHVWGERYDRDATTVFELQDEVVERIVVTIGGTGGKLDQLARAQTLRKETNNLDAYECFLRGREYLNRYRVRDPLFARGGEMFEQAITLDPGFVRAYLGLAWFHIWEVKSGRVKHPGSTLERAFELAERALDIESSNNWNHWSHWILGNIFVWKRSPQRAVFHYERAMDLNPNDAAMLMDMADNWCYLGAPKKAIDLAERALRLHPEHPDVHLWTRLHADVGRGNLAFAYFTDQRYQQALVWLKQVAEPGDCARLLAVTYAMLGQIDKARAAGAVFLREWPNFSIERWAASEPYQNPKHRDHYTQALTIAGLPA